MKKKKLKVDKKIYKKTNKRTIQNKNATKIESHNKKNNPKK